MRLNCSVPYVSCQRHESDSCFSVARQDYLNLVYLFNLPIPFGILLTLNLNIQYNYKLLWNTLKMAKLKSFKYLNRELFCLWNSSMWLLEYHCISKYDEWQIWDLTGCFWKILSKTYLKQISILEINKLDMWKNKGTK